MHDGWMDGSVGWGMLFMVIPAVFLILILLATLRVLSPQSTHPPSTATAQDVLDVRYARGEISRDEYLRLKDDLANGPTVVRSG